MNDRDKYEYAMFAAANDSAVQNPIGNMFDTHSLALNRCDMRFGSILIAIHAMNHPNHDPSELTNIGQLKDVSVMRCLFANINTVATARYATAYASAYTAPSSPYVLSSIAFAAVSHARRPSQHRGSIHDGC
jgi:hypothetical protein